MSSYLSDARSDAQDTANHFFDEILESFMDNDGKASDDLNNDYSDSYHHENHVDRDYSLTEAAELLDELNEYEETDSGLWHGLEPRRAVCAQAAYTYGNAVYQLFTQLIEEINDDTDLCSLFDEYNSIEDTVQEEWDEAEETHNEEVDRDEEEYEELHAEDDAPPFERPEFQEPFDIDEETEKRQEACKEEIKKRMEEIIKNYA